MSGSSENQRIDKIPEDEKLPPRTSAPLFTSSSESFNPRPYLPHASSSIQRNRSVSSASSSRNVSSSSTGQQKTPRSIYDDANNVIIRSPFTDFPGAEESQEGLTYRHFQLNTNWYLHVDDFRKEGEDESSGRIVYPSCLEPGRGWCPASKKDVKEKGIKAMGDNIVKLRCTLCEKEYGGVNAKSMWRRHVLEKHRIPMANRRDETIGRGRSSSNSNVVSSNKENTFVSRDTPLAEPIQLPPPKPKKASPGLRQTSNEPHQAQSSRKSSPETDPSSSSASVPSSTIFCDSTTVNQVVDDNESYAAARHSGPILVPDDTTKTNSKVAFGISNPAGFETDEFVFEGPSSDSPTRTPGRVVKKRKMIHPWKYSSPSHPLYQSPDELNLGIPIKGITGEGLRSKYVALQASPFPGTTTTQSQLSSPVAPSPLSSKIVTGRVIGLKRPKNRERSKLPSFPQPSPLGSSYRSSIFMTYAEDTIPDLTWAATDNEGDYSLPLFTNAESVSEDSILDWFELNSPISAKKKNKGKALSSSKSSLPETPLRRASSLSVLEDLQLVKAGNDDISTLPPSLGRFDFELPGSSGSSNRRDDHPIEFGDFIESPTKLFCKTLYSAFGDDGMIAFSSSRQPPSSTTILESQKRADSPTLEGRDDPFLDDLPLAKKRRTIL